MPSIDELLLRNKERLEKLSTPAIPRKKMTRTGPTRPWQDHLPRYKAELSQEPPVNPSTEVVVPTPLPQLESEPNGYKTDIKQVENGYKTGIEQVENGYKTDISQIDPEKTPRKSLERDLKPALDPELNKSTSSTSAQEPSSDREQVENGHKTDIKQVENGYITDIKQVEETEDLGKKQVYNRVDEQVENRYKTGRNFDKLIPSTFVGLQKQLLRYLFNQTKFSREHRVTDELNIGQIAVALEKPRNCAKSVLNELVKKGAISRHEGKDGPGGWTRFMIQESLYNDLVLMDSRENQVENGYKTDIKQVYNRVDNRVDLPSSSSSINTNKTTTGEPPTSDRTQLPPDWKEIDYSSLVPYRFTENHLLQIYQSSKVSADVVQESIYELHYDLTVNQNKVLRNPRNVLLSLLKKGVPYTAPGYEPEYLKAERRCLEEQKKRREELVRIRQETEQLKGLPSQVMRDAQFQLWLSGLTMERRREIAPHAKVDGSEMQRGLLRSYWESHILTSNKDPERADGLSIFP